MKPTLTLQSFPRHCVVRVALPAGAPQIEERAAERECEAVAHELAATILRAIPVVELDAWVDVHSQASKDGTASASVEVNHEGSADVIAAVERACAELSAACPTCDGTGGPGEEGAPCPECGLR